ncbi:MAG: hypothetical protein ACRYG2_33035, partial [Janthinobacterium lividum]
MPGTRGAPRPTAVVIGASFAGLFAAAGAAAVGALPVRTAVRLMPTRASPMGGTALPLEDGRWLVGAEGYGTDRPGRGEAEFAEFLRALPDPALADMVAALEPVDEVHVHRQTANRRLPTGPTRTGPPGCSSWGTRSARSTRSTGRGSRWRRC